MIFSSQKAIMNNMSTIEVICIECDEHFMIDPEEIGRVAAVASRGQIEKESRDYVVLCPKDHPNKIHL